jgi:uncharacterized protein YozE (UPF0346 family)
LLPFSEGKFHLSFPLSDDRLEAKDTLFPMEKTDFEIFLENAAANPVYEVEPRSFGDLFPISNRTPFKNLFLTSPEILATLGFEGKFLLGLKTIDLIWEDTEGAKQKSARKRKVA